jgi:hypothetical protein
VLSTTLVIPDYYHFYSTPLESFQPRYFALADGSLITPPFIDDLRSANLSLLVYGICAMLFARNIVVSGDYVRRVKLKKNGLFWLLFLSQLVAPLSFVPGILPYFNQFMTCTIVIRLSSVASFVSLSLLITGILGVKAYRCLDNSRAVLIFLAIFRLSLGVLYAFDLRAMGGRRKLTGSCVRTNISEYSRAYVIMQLAESAFICCSFLLAVWRSHGRVVTKGRLSIQPSLNGSSEAIQSSEKKQESNSRGWWDYVPKHGPPPSSSQENLVASKAPTSNPIQSLHSRLRALWTKGGVLQGVQPRKPSIPGEYPIAQPTQVPLRLSQISLRMDSGPNVIQLREGSSPVPSTMSRLNKFIPRMVLFREVLRDELRFTTLITGTYVAVAVMVAIGVNFRNGMSISSWLDIQWGIISLLSVHSFGRVVRRHEREEILQHPSAWNSAVRGERVMREAHRQSGPGRPLSPVSVASRTRQRAPSLNQEPENPFADSHVARNPLRHSWAASTTPSTITSDRSSIVSLDRFTLAGRSGMWGSESQPESSGLTTPAPSSAGRFSRHTPSRLRLKDIDGPWGELDTPPSTAGVFQVW